MTDHVSLDLAYALVLQRKASGYDELFTLASDLRRLLAKATPHLVYNDAALMRECLAILRAAEAILGESE